MDVTDIGKVTSRKRMNTDAEKLREKVSRETAKIIKLKVAQDTAYWDLKERLQQLQGAHERLQQNMVEVQMQHEAASAHYTGELRLRPDTLNKLAGARGVCDVLEQYGARLRGCVARARADRAALQAAYAQAGARVRRLGAALGSARRGAARAGRLARRLAAGRAARAEAEARAAAAEAGRAALAARLRHADDAARLLRDQAADMKLTIARLDDEWRAARADAEQQRRAAEQRADLLRRADTQLADAKNTIDSMKQEEATHIDEINNLKNIINDKSQHEQDMEAKLCEIKQQVHQLETEKHESSSQLAEWQQRAADLSVQRDVLTADLRDQRALLDDAHAELAALRLSAEELRAGAAASARELDANSGTIARLMADLRAESDARARADAARAAADLALHAKEDELRAQMTVILDIRSDKERLQERIQSMQNTIDNIQKELTGRLAVRATSPAEQDQPLYSFLSDGSVDGDALDPREVCRRFSRLARGGGRLRAAQGSISLSQVKDDLKIKSRTFFKNKRFEGKPKKVQ